MKVNLVRAGVLAGTVALCGSGFALAATGQSAAHKSGAKQQHPPAGQGQHWDQFAKAFDANGDGKVSKEEFLAKRPMFDKIDGNHDGSVTSDEVKAMPAVQKKGGTGQNFVAHFDGDKDGKVTTAEYDAKRSSFFDKMDKNKDGMIDQSEFKAQPASEDSGA
ncbi:MAG TPA: EF-hand domain-containing protein [Candidatus Polarisedimenticolia bacterium]|jgi:Ca2+-binding EF-hand superfamily protein|nr:EF-hand domain-containing protein [Candidatus Polarisedimenticolia bacterium]